MLFRMRSRWQSPTGTNLVMLYEKKVQTSLVTKRPLDGNTREKVIKIDIVSSCDCIVGNRFR